MSSKTNKPFTVQGRDGKIYTLTDNAINILEDAPGEEYCFTVIQLKDYQPIFMTKTDASFLEHLSKDKELSKQFYIDGVSH